jgi:cell division protein DivIC
MFVKIFNHKKFTLFSVFLFIYVTTNLLDGERGLISFFEKQKIINDLNLEKKVIENKLINIERKNNLLTNSIDLDFLEILYREKFMIGKSKEKLFYEKK